MWLKAGMLLTASFAHFPVAMEFVKQHVTVAWACGDKRAVVPR